MPKQSVPRVMYRFVSGRPLDGVARTDATYRHAGTRPMVPGRKVSRWSMLPGWQRQAYRLGVPAGVGMLGAVATMWPDYTMSALAALTGLGAVYGLRTGRHALRWRRFRAVYIRPTRRTLMAGLGHSVALHIDPTLGNLVPRLARPLSPAEQAVRAWYGEHVERYLRLVPDMAQRGLWAVQAVAEPVIAPLRRPVEQVGASIRLTIDAPYLSADDRKLVSSVIGAKIPVRDTQECWDMVGPQISAVWTVRQQPPARVGLEDIAPHVDTIREDEFVLGLAAGGRPFTVSLADDAPHIAISAGSGAGKSVLAQLLAAQVLRRGGHVTILDLKGSHRWAKGLAGVTYCTTSGQQHDALVRLAAVADRRNAAAFESDDDDYDAGPRELIICEELNATISELTAYWSETRERSDPKLSPAINALRFILFTGRSARVNVVAIAQMLTARAIGGPEARENFAIRCLARYTRNAWQMLVPQAGMPRTSRVRGRWAIVVGDSATSVQVAFLTGAQVRMLARVTEAAKIPDARPSRDVTGDGNMIDPLSEPLTLREAIDEGVIPWTYEAAKMRLSRARRSGSDKTPKPLGKSGRADVFRRGDLVVWVESEMVP